VCVVELAVVLLCDVVFKWLWSWRTQCQMYLVSLSMIASMVVW